MVCSKRAILSVSLPVLVALILAGCGEQTGGLEVLRERIIKLPTGAELRVEVMMTPLEMQRGMMFRDSVARNRGLLFIHAKPGNYSYWMYQVRIPLDIIWMDPGRRIVQILANVQPCRTRASECPTYGGSETANYVLELAGGEAARLNLRTGQVLDF